MAKKSTTKKTTKKSTKKSSTKVTKPRKPKADKVAKEPKVPENRIYLETQKIDTKRDPEEKSGAFIKRMLETNYLTNSEIIEAVQANYPDSKVGNSDIGFHRTKLKAAGTPTQVVRFDKNGERYTLGI